MDDIDDIQDILLLLDMLNEEVPRRRRPRILNVRPDYFNLYDDLNFKKRFRLTKESVMMILGQIESRISPATWRNNAVSPLHRLLITLRFYATGCMLQTAADYAGISLTSACDFVHIVSVALCGLRGRYISMPTTADELGRTSYEFMQLAQMPSVLGTIDCTHIKLQSPGGHMAEVFRNRKGYMSLNVQTVSDAKLRIRNIVARWPGSAHDQNIFNNSMLKSRLESGQFGDKFLLGDSGYANTSYLVTPVLRATTAAEQLYNESQIRTRNTVERQYGVWKRRFPVLYLGIRLSLSRAQTVITACAVLHNIAIEQNEDAALADEDVAPFVNDQNQSLDPNPSATSNEIRRTRLIRGYFQRLVDQGQ